MRSAAFPILLTLGAANAPTPKRSVDQPPATVITAITPDTLHLVLRQPAYLIVLERAPQRQARLLYPRDGQDWAVTPPGPRALAVTGSRVAAFALGARLDAQCVINIATARTWDPTRARATSATRATCGPQDYPSNVSSGYWQGGEDEAYVIVIAVDTSVRVRGLGAITNAQSPINLARTVGDQVTSGRQEPTAWEATAVRLR